MNRCPGADPRLDRLIASALKPRSWKVSDWPVETCKPREGGGCAHLGPAGLGITPATCFLTLISQP